MLPVFAIVFTVYFCDIDKDLSDVCSSLLCWLTIYDLPELLSDKRQVHRRENVVLI